MDVSTLQGEVRRNDICNNKQVQTRVHASKSMQGWTPVWIFNQYAKSSPMD